jgi:hypothetical protein
MVIQESKNIDWKNRSRDPTFAAEMGSIDIIVTVLAVKGSVSTVPDEPRDEEPDELLLLFDSSSDASRSLICSTSSSSPSII